MGAGGAGGSTSTRPVTAIFLRPSNSEELGLKGRWRGDVPLPELKESPQNLYTIPWVLFSPVNRPILYLAKVENLAYTELISKSP